MKTTCNVLAIVAITILSGARPAEAELLVDLDASVLPDGVLASWPNKGTLGGRFINKSQAGRGGPIVPLVESVDGRKAVTFNGVARLQSDFLAPETLGGANPFTIAVWAYNPSVETSECIVSWCDRYDNKPEAQYGGLGWGSSVSAGAYYRYGTNLTYHTIPSTAWWHHIVITFSGGRTGTFKVYVDGRLDNTLEVADPEVALQWGYPITLGAMRWSNNVQEWCDPFSGSLAAVQIYDHELSGADIVDLYGPALLVDLDASRLRFGPLYVWPNQGVLGGTFRSQGTDPEVGTVDSHRAVTFDGNAVMQSDFVAPGSLGDTHPFTIAVWAHNEQIEPNEALVNWCDRADSPDEGQYGTFGWGTSDEGAYSRPGEALAYKTVPSADAWHHIAVTYSGTESGTFKVYVDGLLDNALTVGLPYYQMQHSRPIALAALRWSGPGSQWVHPFSGSLASVKIYNYELTYDEIVILAANRPMEDFVPLDGPGVDITLFVATDMHYGVGGAVEATRTTINQMNDLPGTLYPDSVGGRVNYPEVVVVTGDLTEDGLQVEWDMFVADFGLTGREGLLYHPVYEGWGNHDQHPGNTSPVTEGVKARNEVRPGLTHVSANGYHYSWDSDGVHFVMLNEYPGTGGGAAGSWGAPLDSLPFLRDDLETQVGDSGRGVVIFAHFAFDGWGLANWKLWEQEAFYQAIKDYNVIALIGGHGHTVLAGQWNGIDYYEVAATQPLSGNNGFSVLHISQSTLTVASRLNASDTWGEVYQKDIDLPEPEPTSTAARLSVPVYVPSTRSIVRSTNQ